MVMCQANVEGWLCVRGWCKRKSGSSMGPVFQMLGSGPPKHGTSTAIPRGGGFVGDIVGANVVPVHLIEVFVVVVGGADGVGGDAELRNVVVAVVEGAGAGVVEGAGL